ncbi:MAG: prephenate dehydrogenase [Bacteroidota bacterium]
MIITVIGLGLIGGSFAKTLKNHHSNIHVIGSDIYQKHEKKALELGLVDECLPFENAISQAEIILLAVPVNIIEQQLKDILDKIEPRQLVIDFGSTKHNITASVAGHRNRKNYLAAHPMAGTENTGPEAAFAGLYTNKILIICDQEFTDNQLLEKAISIFNLLSFQLIYMDSKSHDKHIAYVSHLSHVSSFMLGLTVLDIEQDEKNIFHMAGSGFQSTVRLAMSSADMWTPIFIQNKSNVKKALSQYITQLKEFEEALDQEDEQMLHQMMSRANNIKKALDKKQQL